MYLFSSLPYGREEDNFLPRNYPIQPCPLPKPKGTSESLRCCIYLGKQCSTTGVDLQRNAAGGMGHPSTCSVPVSGILPSIVIAWPKCLLAAKVLLALVSFKRNMELLHLETAVHCEPKRSKWGLFKDQECIPGPFWTRSKLQQQKK